MKTLTNNNQEIYLLNIEELSYVKNDGNYSVLIDIKNEKNIETILPLLKQFTNEYCIEIYCVGLFAERLHDYIDDIVEDLNLFNIITTWSSDESFDEICFYFFHLASSKSKLLFVVSENIKFKESLLSKFKLNDL